MARTTEAMRADRSTLFLVDAKRRELWSKVAQGMERAEIRFPMHVGIAGHVATTGETLNIPDAYEEPRFNKDVDRLSGYRTHTILCMPLRNASGAVIGVMQCLNKQDGAFAAEDEALLGALCSQAAIALENARLFEEVVAIKNYNESILRSMATGVLTLDADGRVTTINPAALRILDLDQDRSTLAATFSDVLLTQANPDLAVDREQCPGDGPAAGRLRASHHYPQRPNREAEFEGHRPVRCPREAARDGAGDRRHHREACGPDRRSPAW